MAETSDKIDRISIWIVFIIGAVIIFGGILQIRSYLFVQERTIISAFQEKYTQTDAAQALSDSEVAQNLSDQQKADTDTDGFSDFDELYIHNTSPYLTDSDSDKLTDKQEIEAGTDPNCPEGGTCEQVRTGGDGTVNTAAATAFSSLSPQDVLTLSNTEELTTSELREALKSYGVSEEQLNSMSDEELQAAFQETLSETTGGASATGNILEYADSIKSMSADEKRQFLLSNGVTQAQLDTLNDSEVDELLNTVVDETLKEQGVSTDTAAPDTTPTEQTNSNQ